MDFLDSRVKRSFKMMTTGVTTADDPGGFFQACTATDGASGSTLTFGSLYGTDGTGESFDLASGTATHNSYFVNVPFEDTAGQPYYLAAKQVDVGQSISFDSTTGIYGIDNYQKVIGQKMSVNSVVNNGDGTITLNVNHLNVGDNYVGRTACVYLKTPVSGSAATAFKTVTFTGPAQILNCANLGQPDATASTATGDYEIIVYGPVVTHTPITPTDAAGNGMAFIGKVTGGSSPRAFDTSAQDLITPLSGMEDRLEEFISNGWITAATAPSYHIWYLQMERICGDR